jgi:small-conductance mechanosensitive channel
LIPLLHLPHSPRSFQRTARGTLEEKLAAERAASQAEIGKEREEGNNARADLRTQLASSSMLRADSERLKQQLQSADDTTDALRAQLAALQVGLADGMLF